jgi:glyoxylase-like metal-dependent hydrolase (beta-lactamase superfamily II)
MSGDAALSQAREQVERSLRGEDGRPIVRTFFDEATFTASHVVHDPQTRAAAVIDSVMDYDPASGRTSFANADLIVAYVEAEGLKVDSLLETHAHADHLSAAPYLQRKLGGRIAIGEQVRAVQEHFAKVFGLGSECPSDGSQFDRLFSDGDTFEIGSIPAIALHVPGHTPADLAYVIGDAAFVGDTLFMPDYGTARCDFPGGDARQLYRSIQRLMQLPDQTRLFLCHDYQAPNRPHYVWETTVGAERRDNVHVRDGTSEDEFVAMRTRRDATLSMPKLMLPAVQVNLRGGRLPEADANGTSYLKIPLNRF